MLRVGLTGELGSGKSTVARMLADRGAIVLSSDDMARDMMQPGQAVYQAIVEHFGPAVVLPNGDLDRRELARLAFDPDTPRVEELNAIVHPAVIAEQERRAAEIARTLPNAVVVVESALMLTTKHAGGDEPWRRRFDRIVVVTAPDHLKLDRFVRRSAAGGSLTEAQTAAQTAALRSEAERRLQAQRAGHKLPEDVLLVHNAGDLTRLGQEVDRVWALLTRIPSPAPTGNVTPQ